ncbi:MAG: GTPase HflX [Oscillospiraceae bacterium]|jgi:GTP-binding protein HflX|nr:GTPase HflX [Oscillospiraceae bacterium]
MINGNITGIRKSWLSELDALYGFEPERDRFIPLELARALAFHSARMNREISLYMSRAGEVLEITIGALESVPLSSLRLRRNISRLAGVRCLHTHPGGDARLSDVDLQALVSLRLDAISAIGVNGDGEATGIQSAFLGACVKGLPEPWTTDVVMLERVPHRAWLDAIERADAAVLEGETETFEDEPERAILLGDESDESLKELAALADTAGAVVVQTILQKRAAPDNATYLGKGKIDEAALDAQALRADMAICDDELTGSQLRNLETALGVRVIDRTSLILDIFAQHAHSREGRLQVELAQLNHQLTRLIGEGLALSRLGGGIGTRGPGETKLEVGRRRIRERITDLKRELESLSRERALRRERRESRSIISFALVGYTNAGKSSLLNALTGANALAEDRLFATLDPLTRRFKTPEGDQCLITDTVGFIRKLPAALVDAFKSTLEEAALADALIIVSDASSAELAAQRETVKQTLKSLGADGKPTIEALNKTDIADTTDAFENAVRISAKTGDGLNDLIERMREIMRLHTREAELLIPFAKGAVLSMLHEQGRIISETFEAEGTRVVASGSEELLGRAARMIADK